MEDNVNLVYFIYNKHFKTWSYLKDDLISEGFLAMCRAEKHFDETRGSKKSAYLSKAIYMSMYKYLKKEQKHLNNVSLDRIIDDYEDINLTEVLPAPDLTERCLTEQVLSQLFETEFDSKTKQIINLHLSKYTQNEIANIMNLSQPHVSRIIKRFRKCVAKNIGGN